MAEFAAVGVETPASALAKAARFLLPGFIYGQRPSFHDLAIQLTDGSFHIRFGSQFRKSEASRPAGFAVPHNLDFCDRNPGFRKKLAQFCIRDIERQISNKKLVRHRASTCLEKSGEIEEGGNGCPDLLKLWFEAGLKHQNILRVKLCKKAQGCMGDSILSNRVDDYKLRLELWRVPLESGSDQHGMRESGIRMKANAERALIPF
jgi:hypothetical protein